MDLEDDDEYDDHETNTATAQRPDAVSAMTGATNVVTKDDIEETAARPIPAADLLDEDSADAYARTQDGSALSPEERVQLGVEVPPAGESAPTAVDTSSSSAAGIVPRPMPPAATAEALHEEDEDGPTMVVSPNFPGPFPKGPNDDEATQVHRQLPGVAAPFGTSQAIPDSGSPGMGLQPHMSGGVMAEVAHAQRQAAMDAALQAALGSPEDAEQHEARRAEQLEMAVAALLGVGMTLGSLSSYLSASSIADGSPARAASYAGLTVLCTLAMFAGGMATLQRKPNHRMGLFIGGCLLLVFAITRLLVIAIS